MILLPNSLSNPCWILTPSSYYDILAVLVAIFCVPQQPTYKQVSAGVTGHAESVEVKYDPSKITYEELLDVFWHQINPTQVNRQFCDGGKQYRSAIWYANDAERQAAEASKAKFAESGVFGTRNLVTEISPLKTFWPAEDYHQVCAAC